MINDACNKCPKGTSSSNRLAVKETAIKWLTSYNQDFLMVMEFIGIDPQFGFKDIQQLLKDRGVI